MAHDPRTQAGGTAGDDPVRGTGEPAHGDPARGTGDPRRRIPRTDALLALPPVEAAVASLGESVVKGLIRATQDRARTGAIAPEAVQTELLTALGTQRASSLTPVLNATGVLVHTNLGRAPLSQAARTALADAAGYTDLEFDLASGSRSRRGAGARASLLAACPAAEDALVVNNGAAALMLATTAYAQDASVLISRGEFVEIGAGFRLSDLIESAGVVLTEVGTTNRTHLADYSREFERSDASADAGGVTYLRAVASPPIGAVLKVHRSNFRIDGFTAESSIADLAALCHERDVPLIVDLGSGLLEPDTRLPEEPDAATALAAGADVVIASGDKLLGGPQAGILLGRADVIATLSRHPMARAVRADKLTLAALEATLAAGEPPVHEALHLDPEVLRLRTERLAAALDGQMAARMERMQSGTGVPERAVEGATADADQSQPRRSLVAAHVVQHAGRVGGGGGTGVDLPGWALAVPEAAAAPLRTGTPAIVGRVHEGRCLIDLRCVPEDRDGDIATAIVDVLANLIPEPDSR
ncbi:L-seryl-tRNA(Sec) selenium transferase [Brevibacterium sp. Mu109]|nr:L-seryl-tRNA(Sec) selenium transferase [Brevibacterium sp. Mu109]